MFGCQFKFHPPCSTHEHTHNNCVYSEIYIHACNLKQQSEHSVAGIPSAR